MWRVDDKTAGLACGLILSLAACATLADIDLEWRPLSQTVNVGDPVGIGLYALSDTGADQYFNSLQVIMTWDPAYLTLTGDDHSGGVGLASSSFTPGDSWGFNEAGPPADGDGIWFGYTEIGQSLPAPPAGSLLTMITFTAQAQTAGTLVSFLATAQKPGRPMAYTAVMSGTYNVVGDLGSPASVTIVPEPATLALVTLLGAGLIAARRR